mgnify:CR=1 FL=1|jgi:carbon storage regulator CsrA
MLVLTRKTDEKITIEVPGMPDIEIMIVGTGKTRSGETKVRIGINAPREYQIVRNELIGTPNGEPKAVS